MNHSLQQKLIAGAVAASAVFGTASLALAHIDGTVHEGDDHVAITASTSVSVTASTTPVRPKDVLKEKREEKKEVQKEQRASTTAAKKEQRAEAKIELNARLDAKKQDSVAKVIRNRVGAFQKIIKEQSKRVTRLEQISIQFKAAGKNTVATDGFLLDARAKLTHASSTLASINVNASSTAGSTNPGQQLNALKTTFDSVKSDLKVVHEDISDAITSLKGLGNIKIHATSTATTTISTQ
ncbi:MAG: hypothetical protein K0S38_811 [Candidatus Paceibacter sp.]|jgi:hypothetical protein|nr:hypothetical protein [Candidatus Paceibacter sp.]